MSGYTITVSGEDLYEGSKWESLSLSLDILISIGEKPELDKWPSFGSTETDETLMFQWAIYERSNLWL